MAAELIEITSGRRGEWQSSAPETVSFLQTKATAVAHLRGYAAGRSTEDDRYWVAIVTDSEHKLFRKPVRITSTRDGVELRRHDTIQFMVEKSGDRNIATDTIKI